jgi:hypothetical protein
VGQTIAAAPEEARMIVYGISAFQLGKVKNYSVSSSFIVH